MRPVAFCLLVTALSHAATTNVTVLVNFEKPHSVVSMAALRQELHALLEPAGIDADVMLKSEMPVSPQFSEVVVFQMKGSCSMSAPSSLPLSRRSDLLNPLAMSYTSDGQVLHFGEVECDRVRLCLQRVTGLGRPTQYEAAYGAALGIVVAHEIYHMLAGLKTHTRYGLTKESLSARELLDRELTIPQVVRSAMLRNGAETR